MTLMEIAWNTFGILVVFALLFGGVGAVWVLLDWLTGFFDIEERL